MPRGLTTAQKAYTGPLVWAAKLTLRSGAVQYFAEQDITFSGTTYSGYLRLGSPVELHRSLAADTCTIELLNADLVAGALMNADDFEGALCELKLLQVGIEAEVLALRGRLSQGEQGDEAIRFEVSSDLDPGQQQLPLRTYSEQCPHRFGASGNPPLEAGPCGYRAQLATWVEFLSETTADIFSKNTIGKASLSMTVDVHKDRVVVITQGTGKDQKRRIKSNTATTLTTYQVWQTIPDSTSKFMVFTFGDGAPKGQRTSTTLNFQTTATSGAARSITATTLAMVTDEHAGDWVLIVAGTGAGQRRLIGANTATAITIASAEADFSPAPDSTSTFRILFKNCPKDMTHSCEQRARTQDFGGFPTVNRIVSLKTGPRRIRVN